MMGMVRMADSPHDVLDALLSRRSVSPRFLREPGPSDADLAAMLDLAVRAPDHGDLRPWRFIVVRGEARARLGAVFAAARRHREPTASDADLAKERAKPLRAPLVIAVAAELQGDLAKIRPIDQVLAAGAAATNLLNAAHVLGYGGMWLTGTNGHDPNVKRALGLGPAAEIVGFLYLGSIAEPPAPKARRGGLAAATFWDHDLTPPGAAPLAGLGRFNA
jgi:nitroreductase